VNRAIALACVVLACGSKKNPEGSDAGGATVTTSADAGSPVLPRVLVDLVAHPDACVLGHEGVLLDLGAPGARALYGIRETAALESTEHDGATWDRISSHSLTLRFAGPIDVDHAEAYVGLRVRGLTAKRVTISLNGKVVGTAPLSKGETTIRELHVPSAQLTNATNELVLHFGGLGKAPDAAAEIDWIQADGDYVRVYVRGRSYLVRHTIGGMEERLDPAHFQRIHRSAIVNVDRVREIKPEGDRRYSVVLRDGTSLTMSRGYRERLTSLIGIP